MDEAIEIEIWSDVACPWCFIGKRRLDAALRRFSGAPVSVAYRSFQLMPEMPAEPGVSHDAFLAARLGWSPEQVAASNRRLADLGAPLGIAFRPDRIRIANTGKAHELLHHAKAAGRQREMKERLLVAYFSEGRNVGDLAELATLAAEIGLDGAEAAGALERGAFREAVEADRGLADGHGISAVPFHVLAGRYGLSGAQETETFLATLEKLAASR